MPTLTSNGRHSDKQLDQMLLSQVLGPNGQPFVRPAAKKPDTTSRGFYGYQRFNGLITEEYVPALSQARKIDVYTRMRSDGLVEAMLAALRLPIIAATWSVSKKGSDANSKRAAALVEEQLDRLNWAEEIREFLSYLQFGFSLMVKQWSIEKGTAWISELRPIHPRTIVEGGKNWDFDDRGRVKGAWQYGTNGKQYVEEYLPAHSFIHCVNDPLFSDPEGRSCLRAAYKHWLIVDTIYRIWAIGLERGAIGTPIGLYSDQATEADQTKLYEFVKSLVAFEDCAGTFPAGTELVNYSLNIQTADIKMAVAHHKTQMAQSILAQWLMLGTDGQSGAYALSGDQTDLFLLCLEAIVKYLEVRINRYLVRELIDYNLDTDQYPRVSATIFRNSVAALATAVRQLTAGQVPIVTPDESLEDYFRNHMGLPPRTGPRAVAPPPADPNNPNPAANVKIEKTDGPNKPPVPN